MQEAMHAARLAQLEGALCALLRECGEVSDAPDAIVVRAYSTFEGRVEIDVEYLKAGIGVSGESL